MAPPHPNAQSRAIRESVTLAISARAAALRAEGRRVISLSAGEPDLPTPAAIAAAGIRAIETGNTRYTATSGTPELRAAAAAWFGREFGLALEPREVMVTAGAKAALHMALSVLVEPGDRVLIPAPYWVSYPSLVSVAGGVPCVVDAVPDRRFVHAGAQIAAAARARDAAGILLNYPNNPSGAVPDAAQLAEIVTAALDCGLWIVSDEIYARLIYDSGRHLSAAAVEGARERTLVVCGGTKSHSFTGWRIGFLAGPAEVIDAAGRVQSQVLGNPSTIGQAAALEMCTGEFEDELAIRLAAFDERRRYLHRVLNEIDGLSLDLPRGAFYALVDARPVCRQLDVDDLGLARLLLDEAEVAVVPGSAFAIPGFIRLSYAAAMEDLGRGVARIAKFVEERT